MSIHDISIAQTNDNKFSERQFDLRFGAVYNLKLDQTFSRLAKSGTLFALALNYQIENDKYFKDLGLNFYMGSMSTRGSTFSPLNPYGGRLYFKQARKIESISNEELTFAVGGSLGIRGEMWFPATSELRYGWDVNSGLGLAIVTDYKISDRLEIRYNLDIHLLGVIWRSQNNGQQLTTEEIQYDSGLIFTAFETPRLSHVFNSFYLDNSVILTWKIHDNFYINSTFSVNYLNINEPLLKKGYEIFGLVGLTRKF